MTNRKSVFFSAINKPLRILLVTSLLLNIISAIGIAVAIIAIRNVSNPEVITEGRFAGMTRKELTELRSQLTILSIDSKSSLRGSEDLIRRFESLGLDVNGLKASDEKTKEFIECLEETIPIIDATLFGEQPSEKASE